MTTNQSEKTKKNTKNKYKIEINKLKNVSKVEY